MLIDIKGVSFAYDGSSEKIFENLNLQLNTDWKLGLIGRNGYGKTTFLKLLQGLLEYSGRIISPIEFEFFPYQISDSLITKNALIKKFPSIKIWQIEKELSLLNVAPEVLEREFNTLSNGEQIKVLLAAMFIIENKFLLIDEPTNHLDIFGREIVARYLNSKHGFILVSHDRNFLNEIVDHILVIEKCNIEVQQGNYNSWYENKTNRDSYEMNKNIQLKKDIKRLKSAYRQKVGWSDLIEKSKIGAGDKGAVGHRSAKMMKRAKNIECNAERAISKKEKLLNNIERVDRIPMQPLRHHARTIIDAVDFSVFYKNTQVFKPVSFTIKSGDILSINGKNGSGKTSILKMLIGERLNFSGTLKIAPSLKISYVPQNFQSLQGSLFEFIDNAGLDKTIFLTTLRKLNFPSNIFDSNMKNFSSGQKKKVFLTKSICEQAHLYIWDEPLNYIDIDSRVQIEQMLLMYAPTLIIVEHDNEFTKNYNKLIIEKSPI